MAFDEQKMLPGKPPAAAGVVSPGNASTTLPGSALDLTTPDRAGSNAQAGTKIRVPGLGVIGEIPKMDFGLELLYGASQPRALETDRNDANGVMVRGTLPLKSR